MAGKSVSPPGAGDLQLLPHRYQVMFALFCLRQIEKKWKDNVELANKVNTLEGWLEGKSTVEECAAINNEFKFGIRNINYTQYAIAYAASTIADIGTPAGYAATTASSVAISFNKGATRRKVVGAQWKYYYELLHFDEIAEKTLLGGVDSER
jgi:hypothetical protein